MDNKKIQKSIKRSKRKTLIKEITMTTFDAILVLMLTLNLYMIIRNIYIQNELKKRNKPPFIKPNMILKIWIWDINKLTDKDKK